jgi:peptide/nickel transport system permease protein
MATTFDDKRVIADPIWKIRLRQTVRSLKKNWGLFAENKIGLIGLVIIGIFGLMALMHPILMNTVWDPRVYDPFIGNDPEVFMNPSPPSARHLLGTDPAGRDILSQLMKSTQSEFVLGILAALVTVIIATSVGAISAYYGGFIDAFFMRLADLINVLPFLALLVVLSSFFEFGMLELALTLGILSGFGGSTIIFKAQALTIKVKPYIEAARIAGGNDMHIIFSHIVPNLMPLAFLNMMFAVTGAIFTEAALSFFGLLNLRTSWGLMINTTQAAGYLLGGWQYWYLIVPAGMSITLLSMAFYLVGRAFDEVINPRLRRR